MITLSWPSNRLISLQLELTMKEVKLVLVLALQKRLVCSKGSSGPKKSSAIMSTLGKGISWVLM